MSRCVILGAGISGLSLAYELKTRGIDVRVFEAEARTGGKIRSERQGDYLIEHGPAGFFDPSGSVDRLARAVGVERNLISATTAAKRRGVVVDGRFVAVPASPATAIRTPLLSPLAKLRVLCDLVLPRGTADDESVASWARRRLGRQAAERIVYPLISGLYAGDPDRISLRSAFPALAKMEADHRSLIFGSVASARGPRGPGLRSFSEGMQTLVAGLSRLLEGRITCGAAARSIAATRTGWRVALERVGSMETDAVVLAMPAHAARPLLKPLSADAAEAAGEIDYVPVAVVHLAYAHQHIPAYGFLVAPGERSRLLGAVFASDVFARRAPDGRLLISARLGGARHRDLLQLDDAALCRLADCELRRILGLQGEPHLAQVVRHERALPQYTIGHAQRVAVLDAAERTWPGLYLSGNAYRGLGVKDCVASAAPLAERIVRELHARPAVTNVA
jgi:oxygen-dependent protoporphyrinogen oxidase